MYWKKYCGNEWMWSDAKVNKVFVIKKYIRLLMRGKNEATKVYETKRWKMRGSSEMSKETYMRRNVHTKWRSNMNIYSKSKFCKCFKVRNNSFEGKRHGSLRGQRGTLWWRYMLVYFSVRQTWVKYFKDVINGKSSRKKALV